MKQLSFSFKTLMLVLSLLCANKQLYAQYDYIPLVEEGKVWNYGEDADLTSPTLYSYFIMGDTVIGGQEYKKLFKQTHEDGMTVYHAAIRESEKRVFTIMADSDKETLLYEFGMTAGSVIRYSENFGLEFSPSWLVKGSDGRIYQLIGMRYEWYNLEPGDQYILGSCIWIEGVGSVDSDLFDPTRSYATDLFQSCYRDSICSFVFEDIFNYVSPDGIVEARKNGRNTTSSLHGIFDLQGRRLATQPRRGLYIKDGRKMVVK